MSHESHVRTAFLVRLRREQEVTFCGDGYDIFDRNVFDLRAPGSKSARILAHVVSVNVDPVQPSEKRN